MHIASMAGARYNRFMSLVKSTATIGFYTLISRVLGFARDVTIAWGLGAGMLSDAFLVSFKLPNFLRRLFAEGAFNSAFVPMFAGTLAAEGEEKAKQFASEAMSFLLLVLLIVSAIFMIFMPWVMVGLAPGFVGNPEKFDLTVTLTRITFPYIIFISLVSLLGGILNSKDKFAAVAATPIVMNLCLIIIPSMIDNITSTLAHGLAIAVMASGVVQWLWLVYFCKKLGVLPKLVKPRLSEGVKKLLVLIAPAAMGAGVVQINLLIDLVIASQFDSGVSYIYYADRINELPLAIIGIAVGTALLPMLSKLIREGKHEDAHTAQNRAIELSLFLSVPAAMALWMIAESVIYVMFARGAFSAADATETAKVLMAFSMGLPAFILVKILAPGFYARHDTKTPFKIAAFCVGLNFILNLALMIPFQYVGMAMATTIASWVNVALLTRTLFTRGWFKMQRHLLSQGIRILATSVVMVIVLYALRDDIAPHLAHGEMARFTALLALVVCGVVAYGAAALAINPLNVRGQLLRRLSR